MRLPCPLWSLFFAAAPASLFGQTVDLDLLGNPSSTPPSSLTPQHDFLFLGEEAFLEPPGEVETRLRLATTPTQRITVANNRSPTRNSRIERRADRFEAEVEWGLAPGFELELEHAARHHRDSLSTERSTREWGLGGVELGLRFSPWQTPRFALTGGVAVLSSEGARASDRSRSQGLEGSLSLSRDFGPFTLHGRWESEYHAAERARDWHGSVARDGAGLRFGSRSAWEHEAQVAAAYPLLERRLWLQVEGRIEREREFEPPRRSAETEWARQLALGPSFFFLGADPQPGEEATIVKFGLAATYAWGEAAPTWGVQAQLQVEFD